MSFHCKFVDDPDHYVPKTFFAKSGPQFCITIVLPTPRTHQNHVFTDSMPFPSNLMQDKTPDQTVTCLTDADMPSVDEILENAQNAKALSHVCDKILNLPLRRRVTNCFSCFQLVFSALQLFQVNENRLQLQSGIKNYSNAG